jgi:1-acyl-sn-glycerol-3-phosphate acyltransferase
MNWAKEILGRIFALWAMLLFVGSLVIVSIPIWLVGIWPEPRRSVYMHGIFRVWMKFFFVLIGVRRIIRGREHFKKNENYIVVCNHNSLMDIPLSTPAIPGANKTIAKSEMAKIPLFGMIYKRGSVLVDRKNEESRRASFSKMKSVLETGLHMCIYPEGTRNKTSEPLQRFHDGAFRLAAETKKSIIPSLIFHTSKVLPRKPFYFWPHKVEMHFLSAVEVDNKTSQQLKEEVFEIMRNYLIHNPASDRMNNE